MKESTYNHIAGEEYGFYSTSEVKRINYIKKLQEKHPDNIQIVHQNSDGSLVVKIPDSWFRILPKKQVNWSEDRKNKAREHMAQIRAKNQVSNL